MYNSITANGFVYIKTDVNGNLQWCKKFGGGAQGYWGISLQQQLNGNLLSALNFSTSVQEMLLMETDSLGAGSGICEASMTPAIYTPAITALDIAYPEEFYADTSVPVPFTITYDSVVTAVDSCPGVPEAIPAIAVPAFHLYPNPTTGLINIDYPSAVPQSATLIITDAYGRVVKEQLLKTGEQHSAINLGSNAAGIYYYRLLMKGSLESSGKLTIVK